MPVSIRRTGTIHSINLLKLLSEQVNSQLHVVRNGAYSIFHAKQSSVEAKESLGKKSFVV